jgi:hypothetical protein
LKKLFYYSLLIFSLSGSVLGQSKKVLNYQVVDEKRLHFGFTIGLNSMDFSFNRNGHIYDSLLADITTPSPGFNVNIVSELKLTDDLALRFLPGLVFGQRSVRFVSQSPAKDYDVLQIESNFIDIPLLIKYSADRINNFKPYLIGGGSVRFDMAAKKENILKTRNVNGTPFEIEMNLKPFDYYTEVGFGFDSYLKYFKLSTEIKLSVGLRGVLNSKMKEAGLNNVSSNIILLNFHFE